MNDDFIAESDRALDAPHPRETLMLLGQISAEDEFLRAYTSGRLHHAWLITGPKGVGKATLAWRIARFVLSQPVASGPDLLAEAPSEPTTLDVAAVHPRSRRIAALSDPGLCLLRIPWSATDKRFKTEITATEARGLKDFFHLSAADGGPRVVIVDAADDLNSTAANALLKPIEEPPVKALILMVAHQPSRLLATIRSRCRELACATLGRDDLAAAITGAGFEMPGNTDALVELASGSVGQAVRLINLGGVQVYHDLVALFSASGQLDRPGAIALANSVGTRGQAERFELILDLVELFLSRLARAGISGLPDQVAAPGEAKLFSNLCANTVDAREWAALQSDIGARARRGKSVNLDASSLLLDMIFRISEAAQQRAA